MQKVKDGTKKTSFELLYFLSIFTIFISCASFPGPIDQKSAAIVGNIKIENVNNNKIESKINRIILKSDTGSTITIKEKDIKKTGYFLAPNVKNDNYSLSLVEIKKTTDYILYKQASYRNFHFPNYKVKIKEGYINFIGNIKIFLIISGDYYKYYGKRNRSLKEYRKSLYKTIRFYPGSGWNSIAQEEMEKINNSNNYYKKAQKYFLKKKIKEGLKNIDMAINYIDYNEKYYNLKGLFSLAKKDYNSALFEFNKALELNDSYSEAYYNRGRTFELKNDIKSAVIDYKKSMESISTHNKYKAPHNSYDYFHIGYSYIINDENKDYKTGLKFLKRSIQVGKNFAPAYFFLGYVNIFLKNYKKAIKYYEKYISYYLDDYIGHYNVGYVYMLLKQYDNAIKYLTDSINKKNDYDSAYSQRAYCWYKKNNYLKALNDIYKAIQLKENTVQNFCYLGLIYMQNKEHYKAIDNFTKAIKISDGSHFRAYYFRSLAYKKIGKYDNSKEDLEKAKSLNNEGKSYDYNVEPE